MSVIGQFLGRVLIYPYRTGLVAFLLLVALSFSMAVPAAAQVINLPPIMPEGTSPIRSPIDENDVNLGTGRLETSIVDLSVGPTGSGGIVHARHWQHRAWRDSFDISLSDFNGHKVVTVGGKSYSYTVNSTTFASEQADGSTLTASGNLYTFTTPDGTTILFDKNLISTDPGLICGICGPVPIAVATDIIFGNGERVKLTYKKASVPGPYFTLNATRLQAVTNNYGLQLKYSYETNIVSSATINNGWIRVSKITGFNNVVEMCDPSADSCSFTHTWPSVTYTRTEGTASLPSNSVETSTDALGRTTRYTFQYATNKMLSVRRPSSSTDSVTIGYNTGGTLSSINKAGVGTWTYTFVNNSGVLTATRSDPLGHTRITTTDMIQLVTKTDRDELNHTTTTTFDSFGRITSVVAPEGNATQYVYDGRGNVTSMNVVPKAGSGLSNIGITAGYAATCTNKLTCNKPIWTRDAKGNQTDYTYDSSTGLLKSVMRPAPVLGGVRPETRYNYSALQAYYKNSSGSIVPSGLPIFKLTSVSECQTTSSCAGSADEVKSVIGYGPQLVGTPNNLLPVFLSTGAGDGSLTATNIIGYDDIGNNTLIDGPLPGQSDTTVKRYDLARQMVGIISPDPDGIAAMKNRATKISYNLDGQVTVEEFGTVNGQSDSDWALFSAVQRTTSSYDAAGRKTKDVVSANGVTYGVKQYSYDGDGRLECTAIRLNNSLWNSLPTSACVAQAVGNLGPDRITRLSYDAANQVTLIQNAFGTGEQANESRTFTSNGEIASVTDGNGNKTSYTYDGVDRILKTQYPSKTNTGVSSSTDYEQFTYDANDNIIQRRLRDGQLIVQTYDNLDRLTLKNTPNIIYFENDVGYVYDNLDRLKRLTGPVSIDYTYDALGRITSETINGISKTMQYDLIGRRTRLTWQDGLFTTYDYLLTGEVSTIKENGTALLASYSYDNLGNAVGLMRGNGTVSSYVWDPASRLTSLTHDMTGTTHDVTLNFTYTTAQQIKSKTLSNDAYTWAQEVSVYRDYSNNGLNQAVISGPVTLGYDGRGNLNNSDGTIYTYTSENRLATSPTTSIVYDPSGRIWQTTEGANITRYDHVGEQLVTEMNSANTILRRYVFAPGNDRPLIWYEGTGITDKRWLHSDERGSVIAISDETGSVTNINSYDDYGVPAVTNVGRFQYTGQAWIPELGMYYFKARIYSPTLGRFLQTDPIGYGDGLNLYTYVHGDPINKTDPSGLSDLLNGPSNITIVVTGASQGFANFGLSSVSIGGNPGGGLNATPAFGGGTDLQSLLNPTQNAAQRKGERGRTAKPGGTKNPDKHVKPGTKPGTKIFKDPHTGQKIIKPWPEDPRLPENQGNVDSNEGSNLATVAAVAVGAIVIVGGLILLPEVTIPALLISGLAAQ